MPQPKLQGPENDLHRAIQRGDAAAVRAWVAAGKSLEDRDPTATTPLALAAFFNKPAVFDELLAAGAGTEPTDDGNHVLFYAAWRGSRKMVQALLDRNVGVDCQFKNAVSTGQTALMGAVKGGHLGLVKLLVGRQAQLGLTDKDGKTALDYAVENGEDDIAEYLKGLRAPGKPVAGKRAKAHPGEKLVAVGRLVIESFPERAARPAYKAFLARLTKLVGQKPKAYENPSGSEYGRLKGVYAVHFPAACLADRPGLLADLRQEAAAAGGTLVDADSGQDPRNGIDCVVFPTADKVAVVLAQETSSNGIVGADTEDIVAFVEDLDRQNPFWLTTCAHDTIAGEFDGPVRQAATWARRLLAICPGEEEASPAGVAATLKEDGYFLLWWD
jgi:hypothetical protein